MNIYYGLFILAVVVVMHNASHVFTPIHFSLITHHFLSIYLVILQMNEHIRLKRTKNVRGGVHNKQLHE